MGHQATMRHREDGFGEFRYLKSVSEDEKEKIEFEDHLERFVTETKRRDGDKLNLENKVYNF